MILDPNIPKFYGLSMNVDDLLWFTAWYFFFDFPYIVRSYQFFPEQNAFLNLGFKILDLSDSLV